MLLIAIATLFWSLLSVTRALSPLSSRNFTPITHLAARDLPVGTCDATTPCVNSACCGTNGLCGYSPLECGSGNCTSNCDAKAECGEYGVEGSQNCPLGVCCSKFGFCGETSDFCGTGCQAGYGGCGDVDRPSCTSGSSINKRTIGYYESWSSTRTCQSVSPAELNLNGFTHINFAFAFFDPSTFQVTPMDSNAASLYSQFTDLKGTYNGLQTWISVGGWSFTDPGVTRNAFSNMAASETNTQTFINGLIKFMDTYGFDGIDLDWEYPAADDRGGVPADFTNYVSLVKAIRLAFGTKYGFSITLPTSYWYLQHFDLANIQDSVDWFNFMAYDLHGTWDAQSIYVGPYIAPHTNITEIDAGLDLLWRAGVTPAKVTMGLAWYGRSFTLIDPTCNTPNGVCKFSGGANAGPCSNASGILDYQEIQDIISTNSLTPVHDTTAAVKWITWDSNQWISYDDSDTFTEKRAFANSRCLGGTMVWAIDQMDQTQSNGMGVAPGVTVAQQSSADQASADQLAQTVCYTSDCGAGCKSGTTEVSEMNGQPGSVSTTERCDSGVYESLCCANGGTMGTCLWRGYRGAGLSCIGGCAAGETEIARNTNYHDDSGDYTCTGGQLSYCCSGFKAASAKSTLASDAENAAEQVAEAAAEQAALDLAAKAFCRVAVPALLAPLELLEDLIPIFGEIADIAELAATPALINLCTDEIEKSGSAEFKVFGKEKSLSFDKPTETAADRPASSSHESATTKESSSCSVAEKVKRADLRALSQTTTYTSYTTSDVLKTCTFGKYPQACGHYSSVINRWPAFSTIACTWKEITDIRPAPDIWTGQHNKYWSLGWMQEDDVDCQGDEFPPAVVWQARDNKQWIRQLPQSQNGPAGALFANVCPETPKSSTISSKYKSSVVIGCRTTSHYSLTEVITWPALVLKFSGDGGFGVGDEYGLSANPCWPSSLIDDPGWALMTNDAWYDDHPASKAVIAGGLYAFSPPASYTSGKINRPDWNKRGLDLDDLDPEGIIFVDANSTRKATDEELREQFGFQRCAGDDCSMEKEALGIESAPVRGIGKIMPATTTVSTTTHLPAPSLTSNPDSRATGPALPLITGMPKRFPTKSKDQIQKELRELLDMVAS